MKTTILVSAKFIEVTISGITIVINPKNLFKDLQTLKAFWNNIIPEERKESVAGFGFDEFLENIEKYKPFVETFMECFTFQDGAKSTMIINEDGTVNMHSTAQSATFNFKKYIQLLSDISKLQEESFKAKYEAEESEEEEHRYWFQVESCTQPVTAHNLAEALEFDVDQILEAVTEFADENVHPHEHLTRTKIHMFSEAFRWKCIIQRDGEVTIINTSAE